MTAKSRDDLNSQADTDLADNTAGDISAADVRGVVKDLADSCHNPTTDGAALTQTEDVTAIVVLTETEYDALDPPAATTLYLVTADA